MTPSPRDGSLEVRNMGLWDWFVGFLTQVLELLANGVGDWGLAIIVLTAIIRLALTPLTVSSTRSTARMQILQPKMAEIQERYADDPQRMNEEMQRFYSENKFNPLGGCLPIFIQMPVFFALFNVLQNKIPEGAHFYSVFASLADSPATAVATLGWAASWAYILFDVAFGVLTLVPMLLNNMQADSQQASMTKTMGIVMAVMMMWFGWSAPIGVVLYYVTSSAWGVVQQVFITRKVLEKAKHDEEERMKNQPIAVDVVRKERKARPHKKA